MQGQLYSYGNFPTTTCHFLYHGLTPASAIGWLADGFEARQPNRLLARQKRRLTPSYAAPVCISSVLSPDAGRMADDPRSDGDQYRSRKMDGQELQHLQRIAAWAGASFLLQALLLGTDAICCHRR
jgi:hypothetical protein